MFLLFLSPGVAMSLYAWLNKNTFVEYMKLFRLTKLFHVADYLDATANDEELTYPKFLLQYWDNWLTRMLSCPVCLSPWITLTFTGPYFLLYGPLLMVPGTLFVAYAGLMLYFLLVKMVNT